MKSLIGFLQQVLDDLGTWCGTTSTNRDLKTITARIEHEGLAFLAITLANFGKDLEKGLDQGFVDDAMFAGFSRHRGLPRFLSGFLRLVFDPVDGQLLQEPSVEAIRAIRQLTLMWSKIKVEDKHVLDPSLKVSISRLRGREQDAFDGYMECEKDVRASDASADPDRIERYSRIGRLLWANVFADVDLRVYNGQIRPKHGPGATADRLSGNRKWDQREWTWRLEQVFPHWEYLIPSWSGLESLSDVHILEPGSERPSRVIAVPKTLKSPRIIAIEPTCMQYVQQGLLAAISEACRADDIARQLVGGTSQVPNQHLAWQGSRNGALATLDLSEASDRVSNQHVRILLQNHPHLSRAVDSCRTRKADVPGHGVIRLAKFASMGSALTFPLEEMVFLTIIFLGIEDALSRPLTRKDVKSLLGKVRVFGDDIIVPKEYVHHVITQLEAFGLRVNVGKSFWNGKFRESCGKEYYDGHDVSIVRLRRFFPTSRTDAAEIVSLVSTRNQLYKAGLWKSTRYLDDAIERLIPFPRVSEQSPVVGRHSFLGPDLSSGKMDPDTHRPLVRGVTIRAVLPISRLEGWGALQKCLTRNASSGDDTWRREISSESWLSNPPASITNMPVGDVEHLLRSGRVASVSTKMRWAPST